MAKKKSKGIKAEYYDENEEEVVEIKKPSKSKKTKKVEPEEYYEDEIEQIIEEKIDEKIEEYEDALEEEYGYRRRNRRFMKIFNIIFFASLVIMTLVAIDVIRVAKYDKTPFFAIKTKTYDDGGTKEYYGIGYKVYKYNVTYGRKDTKIGGWSLKYNIVPTEIDDVDLAIEFENNYDATGTKYYKEYVKITSTYANADENVLVLEYKDEGGKYTLQTKCEMTSRVLDVINPEERENITVHGTIYKFSIKSGDIPNAVYLANCEIE